MTAPWDQTIEHVFNSSGITSIMRKEYPAVYQLMQEELESTSTYMDWTAKMKSIPFQWTSASSSKHDESNFIQSVSRYLDRDLPSSVHIAIGQAIKDKCSTCLSSLRAIPPGRPCTIVDRFNGLDDWNNDSLFWSCAVDLNLFEGASTSTRSSSKGLRLEGSFNLSILACNRGILDKTETDAEKDYNAMKAKIIGACPRLALFAPIPHSIPNNQRSPTLENDKSLQSSFIADNNKNDYDQRSALRSFMNSNPDSAVSLLKIREPKNAQLPVDAMVSLRFHMQDHINLQLRNSRVFIVNDRLIIVYPQSMIAQVADMLHDFDSNGRHFTSASVVHNSWGLVAIYHRTFQPGVRYDDIMSAIS